MLNVQLSQSAVVEEQCRIVTFMKSCIGEGKVVVGVSGGVDSDLVARLLSLAVAPADLKLFFVLQEGMDESHLRNAQQLACELSVDLVEIDLRSWSDDFVSRLAAADTSEKFLPEGILDRSRAKCSLRMPIFSSYQDHGYLVIGTSNRTEYELGFFMPFGDGIANLKPLVHLYKSQVLQLAEHAGSSKTVLAQPPSAGFWKGQTDLEDLAFWLLNEGPTRSGQEFGVEDYLRVDSIAAELTTERVDQVLYGLNTLRMEPEEIVRHTGLSFDIVLRFQRIIDSTERFKRAPFNIGL